MNLKNISTALVVVVVLSFVHLSQSWRRRRRRYCYARNCQVSYWSSWSPCSALKCGVYGSQHRTRSVIASPHCGGTACPSNMQETQTCYGTTAFGCVYSTWSTWSGCSNCEEFQTSSRYIITTEQCGGTPCNTTALRKRRLCEQTQCLNQGVLLNGQCSCLPGYYGSCCQYNGK